MAKVRAVHAFPHSAHSVRAHCAQHVGAPSGGPVHVHACVRVCACVCTCVCALCTTSQGGKEKVAR